MQTALRRTKRVIRSAEKLINCLLPSEQHCLLPLPQQSTYNDHGLFTFPAPPLRKKIQENQKSHIQTQRQFLSHSHQDTEQEHMKFHFTVSALKSAVVVDVAVLYFPINYV